MKPTKANWLRRRIHIEQIFNEQRHQHRLAADSSFCINLAQLRPAPARGFRLPTPHGRRFRSPPTTKRKAQRFDNPSRRREGKFRRAQIFRVFAPQHLANEFAKWTGLGRLLTVRNWWRNRKTCHLFVVNFPSFLEQISQGGRVTFAPRRSSLRRRNSWRKPYLARIPAMNGAGSGATCPDPVRGYRSNGSQTDTVVPLTLSDEQPNSP
jgi:hypothetical protein